MTINRVIAAVVAVGAISGDASALVYRDALSNLSDAQIRTLASALLERRQGNQSEQAASDRRAALSLDASRNSEASLEIMALIANARKSRRQGSDQDGRSAECSVEMLQLLKSVKANKKPPPCPVPPAR